MQDARKFIIKRSNIRYVTEDETWSLRRIRNVTSLKLSSSNESASSSTMWVNLDKSYSSTDHKHKLHTRSILPVNN